MKLLAVGFALILSLAASLASALEIKPYSPQALADVVPASSTR